jgi:predicted ATP-grasp superfamily ATP-dependent carboligase
VSTKELLRRNGRRLDVAVLDAEQRQSLVCVRSLGRAGLRVGAFDVTAWLPAFSSRWCAVHGVLPDYARDPDAFVDGVLDLVDEYAPRVLILGHDGSIEAVRRRRAEVESRVALALAREEALAIATDKARTLALASQLGIPLPRTVPVDDASDVRAAAREVGLPAVVKPERSWVQRVGDRVVSELVVSVDEARRAVQRMSEAGASVVFQQWVDGTREAVWLLHAQKRMWAEFAQVAHRMVPILGGASVVRESVPLASDVCQAAHRLVTAAGLDGFSEVEFRRDSRGRPLLMEINPRLSASIEVAVRAGVDFPWLVYAWAAGLPLAQVSGYRSGLRMRWLGGDLIWLRKTLVGQGRPDVMPAGRALATFAADCFRPAAYDYVSLSDMRPALVATAGFLGMAVRRVRDARPKKAAR